jgi:hypothetical protein
MGAVVGTQRTSEGRYWPYREGQSCNSDALIGQSVGEFKNTFGCSGHVPYLMSTFLHHVPGFRIAVYE